MLIRTLLVAFIALFLSMLIGVVGWKFAFQNQQVSFIVIAWIASLLGNWLIFRRGYRDWQLPTWGTVAGIVGFASYGVGIGVMVIYRNHVALGITEYIDRDPDFIGVDFGLLSFDLGVICLMVFGIAVFRQSPGYLRPTPTRERRELAAGCILGPLSIALLICGILGSYTLGGMILAVLSATVLSFVVYKLINYSGIM